MTRFRRLGELVDEPLFFIGGGLVIGRLVLHHLPTWLWIGAWIAFPGGLVLKIGLKLTGRLSAQGNTATTAPGGTWGIEYQTTQKVTITGTTRTVRTTRRLFFFRRST